MKSTKNQTRALIVLLVIFILYGYWTFLLSPKMQETGALKSQVDAEDLSVRSMYATVAGYETNREKLLESYDKTRNTYTRFYDASICQEDLIDLIASVFSENEVDPVVVNTTDFAGYSASADYTGLNPFGELSAAENPMVESMAIDMEVQGHYSALKDAIQAFSDNDKLIYCNSNILELQPNEGPYDPEEESETETETEETAEAAGAEAAAEIPVQTAEGEETEEEVYDPLMTSRFTINFIRVGNLTAVNDDNEMPAESSGCVMPPEFADSSYRKGLSLDYLKNLFKGD